MTDTDTRTRFWSGEYEQLVEQTLDRAPVLGDLRRGVMPAGDPIALLRRHAAEVRTALDVKLPSRLRLCPSDAFAAKKFFWRLYAEEQGEFVAERNHANLFAALCQRVGITSDELEAEYTTYREHFDYLLTEQPSDRVLVRELTVCCVWESVILRLGNRYLSVLMEALTLTPEDLEYFTVHQQDDTHHSAAALKVLQTYATTEADLDIVRDAIERTLILENPWTLEAPSSVVR